MTYDPDRDARAPHDVNPNVRPYERDRPEFSTVIILGLTALFLAIGAWFYATSGGQSVAVDDRPKAEGTVGSGTRGEPLAKTPPTVRAEPRQ